MARQQNALDFYDQILARLQSYQGDVAKAYELLPREGADDLRELTSGGISSKTLRKMGNPYARKLGPGFAPLSATSPADVKGLLAQRRGVSKAYARRNGLKGAAARAAAPLLPINRQEGNLNRSVTIRKLPALGANRRYRVFFDPSVAGRSLYAVAPRGTGKVVPRGLHTEQRRRWRIRNRAFRSTFAATTRRSLQRRSTP